MRSSCEAAAASHPSTAQARAELIGASHEQVARNRVRGYAPTEGEGGVLLVLDLEQRVQHHGAALVQVHRVRGHVRLLARHLGVPAVDLEVLDIAAGGRLQQQRGSDQGTHARRDDHAELDSDQHDWCESLRDNSHRSQTIAARVTGNDLMWTACYARSAPECQGAA